MLNKNLLRVATLSLGIFMTGFMISCTDDNEDPDNGPTASFQFAVSESNFLEVSFTNFSQNASTYSWDFGDGSEASTEENPTHTFAGSGTFKVVLTATEGDESDTFEQDVIITDPDEALTLLAGTESKTWKLVREGTAMLLASGPDFAEIFWPGSSNNGQRPCLYDDSFTFNRDGSYVYNDAGTFWAEFGVFNGVDGCDTNTTAESCFDATAENLVNECGDDVSAWGSGTHSFEYNSSTGKITLSGNGAWIGIPKLATTGAVLVPESSVTFDAVLVPGGASGVDTLFASFSYEGNFWPFTYVSYSDPSQEPELVTDFVEPPCEDLPVIAPTEISHTFASDEGAVLLATAESGNTFEYAADPAGGSDNVAKLTRVAGVQFQEMKFKFADTDGNKSIDFTNINSLTIEVYVPSTNDFTTDLANNIAFGFGNEQCPPEWFNDQHEWASADMATDEWVTLTYDLTAAADFVNVPDNGATLKDRNDMDLFYINFGNCCHFDGGEVYVRNLVMDGTAAN